METDSKTLNQTFKATEHAESMKMASQAFQQNNYPDAIKHYSAVISQPDQHYLPALLNRGSLYYAAKNYSLSAADALSYISFTKQTGNRSSLKPEVYILYFKSLAKQETKQQMAINDLIEEASKEYPGHNVLKETIKSLRETFVTSDHEIYLDKMYEKLIVHPDVRQWLKEESFLTKVEKLIRNPSLSTALIRVDFRLQTVHDALLMADYQ